MDYLLLNFIFRQHQDNIKNFNNKNSDINFFGLFVIQNNFSLYIDKHLTFWVKWIYVVKLLHNTNWSSNCVIILVNFLGLHCCGESEKEKKIFTFDIWVPIYLFTWQEHVPQSNLVALVKFKFGRMFVFGFFSYVFVTCKK